MGDRNLSGAVTAWPGRGAVDLNLWPTPIVGLDANGVPQVIGCSAPVYATSTITGNAPANTETVVLNGKTYTFVTAGTVAVEGDVDLGANETAALVNLKNAINASGGTNAVAGNYLVAAKHPTIIATASNATTVSIRALEIGPAGNAQTTTVTGGVTVTGATLAGGKSAYLYTAAGP